MAKAMKWLAADFCAAAAVCVALCLLESRQRWIGLAVTFCTFAYHLVMRLAVGLCFSLAMGNRADLGRRWFQPRRGEAELYRRLGVKRWKKLLPTYEPESFDPTLHSWEEIAQATCQSELVHETIMLLSFVPLAAIPRFGTAGVFVATSVAAALFDSLFAMAQRFNRFRLVRLLRRRRGGR